MKTCGIIAEYNPFHKGHIYHLEKARKITQCDRIIVILTSYFSQRGLPSLLTPHAKAKLALENGADLIIELPFCYGSQSAEYFAKNAISSLACLNIDQLCFGSECNDIDQLRDHLNKTSTIEHDASVSLNHNHDRYLEPLLPNDILAMHYIKYCDQFSIEPISIKRNQAYQSATKTRKDYFENIPQYHDEYFQRDQTWDNYYPYLRTYLLLTSNQLLNTFFLVNEGIENRLKENAIKYDNWNDFLNASISKTYSKARIQRTCLFIMMQITKGEMERHKDFDRVKVLGFNNIGQAILKENKQAKIYTQFNQYDDFLKRIELSSLRLYNSVQSIPIKSERIVII